MIYPCSIFSCPDFLLHFPILTNILVSYRDCSSFTIVFSSRLILSLLSPLLVCIFSSLAAKLTHCPSIFFPCRPTAISNLSHLIPHLMTRVSSVLTSMEWKRRHTWAICIWVWPTSSLALAHQQFHEITLIKLQHSGSYFHQVDVSLL